MDSILPPGATLSFLFKGSSVSSVLSGFFARHTPSFNENALFAQSHRTTFHESRIYQAHWAYYLEYNFSLVTQIPFPAERGTQPFRFPKTKTTTPLPWRDKNTAGQLTAPTSFRPYFNSYTIGIVTMSGCLMVIPSNTGS